MQKVLAKNIKFISIQFPVRDVKPLQNVLNGFKDVIFVNNASVFKQALNEKGFGQLFFDSFAGDFGHCTVEGNRLLAENIVTTIINNKSIINAAK